MLTHTQYNTIQIYMAPKVGCQSEVLLGSEPCYILYAAESSAVFKRDLKEASEGADRRSGSREFYTEVAAVEKACDAKYEVTTGS